jgi:hypothetical protein
VTKQHRAALRRLLVAVIAAALLVFTGTLLHGCYAHVPPKPGEPNPADLPPVHDRKADAGCSTR